MRILPAALVLASCALAFATPGRGVARTIRCDAGARPIRIECDDVSRTSIRVAVYVDLGAGNAVGFMRPVSRRRTTSGEVTRYAASRAGARFRAVFEGDVLTRMRLVVRRPRHPTVAGAPFDARLVLTEADVTSVVVHRDL